MSNFCTIILVWTPWIPHLIRLITDYRLTDIAQSAYRRTDVPTTAFIRSPWLARPPRRTRAESPSTGRGSQQAPGIPPLKHPSAKRLAGLGTP